MGTFPVTVRYPVRLREAEGERGVLNFVPAVGIALSPLCFAPQNIGERPKER